jgi:hypothetical protein
MKCFNFSLKVYRPEIGSRSWTIFRDYNEVFNLHIPRYVHGKCSYNSKIIIIRERNNGRVGHMFSIFGRFNENWQVGITFYQYSLEI